MYICFRFLRRRIVSANSRSFPLPHLRSQKELFEGVGISFIGGSDKNRFFERKLSWVLYCFQALQRRRTTIMGEGEECIEIKFRIYDGTDIGHTNYASSTTVATLKQKLVAEWPQDKNEEHIGKMNSCSCTII